MTPVAETRRAVMVPADRAHIDYLMTDIRPEDRAEWLAFTGLPVRVSLEWAIDNGPAWSVITRQGEATLAIFGAHDAGEPDMGLLWFVASNIGYWHVPDFAVLTHVGLKLLHERWPTLRAYADARNYRHHSWLATMEFDTLGIVPCGPMNLPFHLVEKKRSAH